MDAVSEILNCIGCNKSYDCPKILPCGNTVCQKCIHTHLLENKNDASSEFKCFMCEEEHSFPKNNCFPTNQPLSKLLDKELKRFNLTGESSDKLQSCLNNIQKEKYEIENLRKNAVDFIMTECQHLKVDIDLAVEKSIERLHTIRDDFFGQLDDYQNKTVDAFESNKEKIVDLNLEKIYEEFENFEANQNKFDFVQAINIAQELSEKFHLKKTEIQNFIFNKNFISFKENSAKINSSQLGSFHYSALNNLNVNLKDTIDFNKMYRIDFNLNKLVEVN